MTHIKLQILKLIHNFVLNAWLIIYFLELHHILVKYISLNALHNLLTHQHFCASHVVHTC
jgi:hypothetical protein